MPAYVCTVHNIMWFLLQLSALSTVFSCTASNFFLRPPLPVL